MSTLYSHVSTEHIVNLSTAILSDHEKEILSLGLSFVHKPKVMLPEELNKSFSRFIVNKPLRNQIIKSIMETPNKSCLTKRELRGLKQLKQRKDIVIRKADKGDSWVILNMNDYFGECYRQLDDVNYYTELATHQMEHTTKIYKNCLHSAYKRKVIPAALCNSLMPKPEAKVRQFYILPKIHKSPQLWPIPNLIPPGRPIISNVNSIDTNICQYVNAWLTPIVVKLPQVIKSTEQLLAILNDIEVPSSCLLFTMDVESLYTNIPLGEGLEITKQFFAKFPDPKRPDELVLNLLSISLFKNEFQCGDRFFKQTKGVAMGKNYAPNFANIFLADWEAKVLDRTHLKPLGWWRYIDDIFGIWPYSLKSLKEFVELVNSVNSSIKVTANISITDTQFLDLIIFKDDAFLENKRLSTTIYLKPTSSLRLIHKRSFHPQKMKASTIKNQMTRYIRNSSRYSDFNKSLKHFLQSIESQGYSHSFLRKLKTEVIRNNNILIENDRFIRGFHPCGKCVTCRIHGVHRHSLVQNGAIQYINQYMSCETSNIVYVIQCALCMKIYIGETSMPLRKRIQSHLSSIRRNVDTPVSRHFNDASHTIEHLKFSGIKHNSSWSKEKRLVMEEKLIKRFCSQFPSGMNEKTQLHSMFLPIPFKGKFTFTPLLNENRDCLPPPAYMTGTPLHRILNTNTNPRLESFCAGQTPQDLAV